MSRECGVELSLVMIISLLGVIVDTSDINYGVASVQCFWVSCPDKGAVAVVGQKAEEVYSQCLIGVEVSTVRSNKRSRHFHSFGSLHEL